MTGIARRKILKTLKHIEEIKNDIMNNKITLLYITSEKCGICKVISPRLDDMLKSFPEVRSVKANIDELPVLAGEYNVFTVPCILIFIQGKEVNREARYVNFEAIQETIDRYYRIIY
jgi:thiol-disulfide isomerase/thioredoxin